MEVQSVINESALKEARKYLIKPGTVSSVQLQCSICVAGSILYVGRKTVYDVAGSICNCHFLWGIKNDREQTRLKVPEKIG